MTYKPGFQLAPYSDGESFDAQLQAPPVVRLRIEASDEFFQDNGDQAQTIADQIVSRREGQISQFWLAQQHNYNLGIAKVISTELKIDDQIAVRYTAVQGTQVLDITVKPENQQEVLTPSAVDLNLDGYIAWEIGYSLGQGPQPDKIIFDFELNDQHFYTYSGDLTQNSVILFVIGSTGLRCQSLIDKSKLDPTLPGNPNKLVSAVLPPRSPVKEFVNNVGTKVFDHADLPGYFIYDAGHLLNCAGTPAALINPTILDLVRLKNIPSYKPQGLNSLRVYVTPSIPFTSKWNHSFSIYAEFYSRHELRLAQQSWKLISRALNITVNDQPMYWRMSTAAYPVQAMDFDLTPVKVDTTMPTPSNPSLAFNAPFNKLTLWKNMPGHGYWRIGDNPTQQPAPPGGLWAIAITAAQLALRAWNDVLYVIWLMGKVIHLTGDSAASNRVLPYPPFDVIDTMRQSSMVNFQVSTIQAVTDFDKALGNKYVSYASLAIQINKVFPTGTLITSSPLGPPDTYPYAQIAGYATTAYTAANAILTALIAGTAQSLVADTYQDHADAMALITQAQSTAKDANNIATLLRAGGAYTTSSGALVDWGTDWLWTHGRAPVTTDPNKVLVVSPDPHYYIPPSQEPNYSPSPPSFPVSVYFAIMTPTRVLEDVAGFVSSINSDYTNAVNLEQAILAYDLKPRS